MKYWRQSLTLLLALILILGLTACGDIDDNYDNPNDNINQTQDVPITDMTELDGTWATTSGNRLYFDSSNGFYAYQTFYGRTGHGEFSEVNGKPMICFDGFMYDFLLRDGEILLPNQNGDGDEENIHYFFFHRDDSVDVIEWELSNFDGMWQNALGETLVIDSTLMQYIACSPEMLSNGTIDDKQEGKGPYLFLNGFAYLCPSADGNSFTLKFQSSDSQSPDGSFDGVFYRNGDADTYADLLQAEFTLDEYDSSVVWYYDGVNIYYLGDEYTIGGDGLAYNKNGDVFGAGWETPVYDPAEDWGDDWADNWD